MKKSIIVLFFLIFYQYSYSKTIEAELVECKAIEAGCGDVVFNYMFKYKIVKGHPKNKEYEYIYVIHSCIEFKGNGFFVIGGVYKIVVKPVPSVAKYLESNKGKETFVSVEYSGGKVYFEEEVTLISFPLKYF
jgi:hypothetical protein